MLPHLVTLAYMMIKYSIRQNITNLWINKEYEGPNNAALIECKTFHSRYSFTVKLQ
jgi:hypothetical protein